jgi:DNA-binding transcriptional MocR family regulator
MPTGGFHLWVSLPTQIDDVVLAEQALRSDVLVIAGRHWFPPKRPHHFCGCPTPAPIPAPSLKVLRLTDCTIP